MAYLGKSEVKRPWKPLKESRAHSLVQEGGRRGPVEVVGLLSVQPAAGPEVWNPGRCGSDFTSVADGPGGPAGGQPQTGAPGLLCHPCSQQQASPQRGRQPGTFFLIALP